MELHCETPEDVTKSMALELDQVSIFSNSFYSLLNKVK